MNISSHVKYDVFYHNICTYCYDSGERLNLPVDSGTVEMLCGIQTSNPDAVFTWLKDGKSITRTPVFYKDNGRVLVLPDFTPADNGKYTCITNDKSMSSSSTDLTYVDPGEVVVISPLIHCMCKGLASGV